MPVRESPAADRPAPVTPDGRYIVVRGRLWRRADPTLPEADRARLVTELMAARRGVAAARRDGDREAEQAARAAVDGAKRGLGERGPVWWTDGSPDLNRHMAHTTPYAAWYATLAPEMDPTPLKKEAAQPFGERPKSREETPNKGMRSKARLLHK